MPDASTAGAGAATSPAGTQAVQAADEDTTALPSNAAASLLGESLSAGLKAPDANLASSSSGNLPADGGVHHLHPHSVLSYVTVLLWMAVHPKLSAQGIIV